MYIYLIYIYVFLTFLFIVLLLCVIYYIYIYIYLFFTLEFLSVNDGPALRCRAPFHYISLVVVEHSLRHLRILNLS